MDDLPDQPEQPDPLDDPVLDALERSIENPPGFRDPLADDYLQDDTAGFLDALESSIEGSPAVSPRPGDLAGMEAAEAFIDEAEEDGPGTPDEGPLLESREGFGAFDDQSPPSGTTAGGDATSGSPRRPMVPPSAGQGDRGGFGGAGRGRPRTFGGPRQTAMRAGRAKRHCPEAREIIDEDQCTSCDKYRHWPEGTDEEPRECWYDWQAAERFGLPGREDENESE